METHATKSEHTTDKDYALITLAVTLLQDPWILCRFHVLLLVVPMAIHVLRRLQDGFVNSTPGQLNVLPTLIAQKPPKSLAGMELKLADLAAPDT